MLQSQDFPGLKIPIPYSGKRNLTPKWIHYTWLRLKFKLIRPEKLRCIIMQQSSSVLLLLYYILNITTDKLNDTEVNNYDD